MFDTAQSQDRVTRAAWLVALATLVIGQLHALARFATESGESDLELPLTAFWAEPAARALDPLLSWADPDTVYLTYGKWWLPAILVTVLAGVMVQRLRHPFGLEKWGWRVMLVGMSLLAAGAGLFYWGQWTSYNVLDDVGIALDLPGFLIGYVGATMLGIGLLRRGARPRLAAILLLLMIPGFLFISEVTSLGNTTLPCMFAMAMLASSETRARAVAPTASRVSVGSHAATQ
jgi:hypothetical protein